MPTEANQKSKVIKEFSRFAYHYDSYSVIQSQVASRIVSKIPLLPYETIVDIGCGSGEVYKNILKKNHQFTHFIALDSSVQMLEVHPSSPKIQKIGANFNTSTSFDVLENTKPSLILSSSALQWSVDLDLTLSQMAQKSSLNTMSYLAIFTSNTFKTLHQTAHLSSPIYSEAFLKEKISLYYEATFETKSYQLSFETKREMFNYIKKSGVSGGEKQLDFKQTKYLMAHYPLDYLEFEVLFVEAKAR